MVRVGSRAAPATAARLERRANEFAAGFARTVQQESLGHLKEKPVATVSPAMSRKPVVNTQDR